MMPNLAQPFIQGATAGQQISQSAIRTQQMQTNEQQAQLTLQQNQKFAQLMSSMAGTDSSQQNPSNMLLNRGLAALKAGLPQGVPLVNAGIAAQYKMASAAAATTKAQADQVRAQVSQKLYMIKQKEQQLAPLGAALMNVNDENSWQNYLALAHQLGDNDYAGTPYNPQVVDSLRGEFLGAKNAVELAKGRLADQQKQADLQERKRHDLVSEKLADARNVAMKVAADARAAMVQQAEERNTRLAKTGGGKTVSAPPESMVIQAQDLIGKSLPDMHGQDKMGFAFSVAARAKALAVQNPGMDAEVALEEALDQLKDTQVMKVPGDHFWQKSKMAFEPGGKPPPGQPPVPKGTNSLTTEQVKAMYPQAQQAKDGKWYAPLPGGKWGVITP